MPPKLPELPRIRIEHVAEHTRDKHGFAYMRDVELVAHYPDGSKSAPFPYCLVERNALDAVIICAYYTESGRPFVYLRSAVRPPLMLRGDARAPYDGIVWELPAGLIEPGETPEEAGARETEEELGFHLTADSVKALGKPAAPAPAIIGEVHHFVYAEVSPQKRREPSLDGSPLERGGEVFAMPLDDALAHARAGEFFDEKTELGIRRLADLLLWSVR